MDLSCKASSLIEESPEAVSFINTVRGTPASLKISIMALFCRTEITVRTAATEHNGKPNAMRIIGSWGGKGQVVASTAKGKMSIVAVMESTVKAAVKIV